MRSFTVAILAYISLSYHILLVKGTILDISRVDNILFQTFSYHCDNVSTLLIVPYEGIRVTSVRDSFQTFWKATNKKVCASVTLRLDGENPRIAQISLYGSRNSTVNFCKIGTLWMPEYTETFSKHREFLKLRVSPTSKSIRAIELATTKDTEDVAFVKLRLSKMPINIYVPKLERHASSIVHNGVPVWTAEKGERCISAASYLKGEEIYLMHISKNNANNEKSMQFYARDADKWIDIDHKEFNRKQGTLIKSIERAIK